MTLKGRYLFYSLGGALLYAGLGLAWFCLISDVGVDTSHFGGMWYLLYLLPSVIIPSVAAFAAVIAFGTLKEDPKTNSGCLSIFSSHLLFASFSMSLTIGAFIGGLLWAKILPNYINTLSIVGEILHALLLYPVTLTVMVICSSLSVLTANYVRAK